MKIDRALIGALLIGILVLSPSAYAITISVGGDAGGFTENINAGDKDAVYSSTVIAANSLSHSIKGSGNLKESHWVSNTAGANAEVGVDIRRAERYSYSYDLWPGQGSSWPASKFAQVAASEQLDVFNAKYIQAYANALNSKGYSAGVSIVVSDPGKKASLTGYRNLAMASKNEAFASQTAKSAFSLDGFIQADSGADFTRLLSKPLQFREDMADASLRVDHGSVEGYSDLASASANGVTASQQMDNATGDEIRTRSESASWTASLFQGLKKADAKVSTRAKGTLTGYNASAESSKDYAQADQAGHIVGTFTSTALAGKASKTRTSNYGTEYDFDMQAKKDASGSYATGNLGYYVDNVSPIANRIQGAVDASESGDAINVAAGTYFENVQIDKSLSVKGAGAGDTIVDGQQAGSVFTIGTDDPNVDVTLSRMTIQNGLAQDGAGIYNMGTLIVADSKILGNIATGPTWPTWHGYGGGIYNSGTANVMNCIISENTAIYGGGIFNTDNARATVIDSKISGNNAQVVGGGIENAGTLMVGGSRISENRAFYCGGIYNLGTLDVEDSLIGLNLAADNGGGISNTGIAEVTRSTISGNTANNWGGGIFNDFKGILNLNGCVIANNTASYSSGGGVFNSGVLNLIGSQIDSNTARNGGGIFNQYQSKMAVIDSTISGNIASEGDGGGIWNAGSLTLADSAAYDNTANLYGGGIFNDYYGTVNLISGSVDHNNATSPSPSGGGIYNLGTITGNASIVHDNTPDQIVPPPSVDWLPEV